MKNNAFTSQNIVEKLVNHYGLPAFLFDVTGNYTFTVKGDKKTKQVELVPYNRYGELAHLPKHTLLLFQDLWKKHADVVASRISWHAGYHDKVDARSCTAVKTTKETASQFLDKYHLMGYASSASHYALIHEKQIVAMATFSKGRKMDRLEPNQRSFELVRFATIPFVSITGGLSKLLTKFTKEHNPGDVMTYIDPLTGETAGLKRLGFEEIDFTKPVALFVNTKTHERFFKENDGTDLRFETIGNYKLVKTF
ncbi:MAG TPA: hypothetical protein VK177_20735 [Flavobacteriales bacterium]|nr:hypothetical protein [Flavobacteriales bacterium]